MKNSMMHIQNHLVARLEALSDEDLTGDELDREIKRSTAATRVAAAAINNARLMLDADKHLSEHHRANAGSIISGAIPAAGNGKHLPPASRNGKDSA